MRDEVSHLNERISELVIGLYTNDFSMIHDLTKEMTMRNVTLIHYTDGDDVEEELDSLIIKSGLPRFPKTVGNITIVTALDDPSATADRALCAGLGRYRPECLTIGIDPGARPGIAFIADGILIKTESASGIADVKIIIERAVEAIEPERFGIRMGKGDPKNRDRIIDILKGISVPIEIVDEKRTTRGTKFRDQNAAVRIARDPGDPERDSNFKKR